MDARTGNAKAIVEESIMSKYEKVLVVLLMGSLWGALELFGADLFRAWGIDDKSALLFGLGLLILFVSRKFVDFLGAATIMALIAGLFKTASSNFFLCQFAAVMINGIVFDISYRLFKRQLETGPIHRAIAAPVIAYVSYALFAFSVTFVFVEPHWAGRGISGIGDYLGSSALVAAVFSIVTINVGYYLGVALRPLVVSRLSGTPVVFFRISSAVVVAAIWIAGQVY